MSDRLRTQDLRTPVVGAPMAGGPSSPELVAAVSEAGGLGMIAAGYLDAGATRAAVESVRALTSEPFGVNLFLTDEEDSRAAAAGDPDGLDRFRSALEPFAARVGAEPGEPAFSDNDHAAKIALLAELAVPVVSVVFGIPDPEDVRRLREAGSTVVVGVTSVADADRAVAAGADWLCVQGTEAGGHRFTTSIGDEPGDESTVELVSAVRAEHPEVPIVAAGGLCSPDAVRMVRGAGADLVQLGTALLACTEAGTSEAHRRALADPELETTRVTRAFSGRPARALAGEAVRALDPVATPAYPQVNAMTGPMRKAAAKAGESGLVAAWAGTAWRDAAEWRDRPAAEVIAGLLGPSYK